MSPGDTVFSVRGVIKLYHMGEVQVHALRGIDVSMRAGEFIVDHIARCWPTRVAGRSA